MYGSSVGTKLKSVLFVLEQRFAIMAGTFCAIRNGQGWRTEVWRSIRLCSESRKIFLASFTKEKRIKLHRECCSKQRQFLYSCCDSQFDTNSLDQGRQHLEMNLTLSSMGPVANHEQREEMRREGV